MRLLLGDDLAFLAPAITARYPEVETVLPDWLAANPEGLHQIDVAFGGLRAAQIASAQRLRWVQTLGAGVNGLMTPEVRRRGLMITNASGIHAEAITEQMFGMVLCWTRRLHEAWKLQQVRTWGGYDFPGQVSLIAGKTLGVLGVGAIGSHAARVGQAFGMRVVGLNRSGAPSPYVEKMFTPSEKRPFLAETEVLMSSLPLTEKTQHFLDDEAFAALPEGALFCNTGRGGTVDTDSLLRALESGRLGAALLDVTDPEPLPSDHPLWSAPNVVITPHYSGNHPGYRERAGAIFLENLDRFLSGKPMVNVVDQSEGY